MDGRRISKSKLLSRVSVLAVIASTGVIVPVRGALADCLEITTPQVITGTHECAEARFVSGNVTNDGTIGPPEDNDEAGFFVGKGGITGVLTNNGFIGGGGYEEDDGILGALTIATNVSGGVINRGEITAYYGNGIQLGLGSSESYWNVEAAMTGSITNSGVISADDGSGIAARFGTMTGALVNEAGGVISGRRGVYIEHDFTSWSGGIVNAGTIAGERAGVQIGRIGYSDDSDVTFSGGLVNQEGGTISAETGPAVAIGGWEFSGGLTNHGLITQVLPEYYEGEDKYAGVGVVITAETFNDGISNSGRIDGVDGPAIWITYHTNEFNGGIENSGEILSAETAIRIKSNDFSGDFENTGTIKGGQSHTGVEFKVDNFTGNFSNSGTISGGDIGVFFGGDELFLTGQDDAPAVIDNDGLIAGGFAGLYFDGTWVHAELTNSGVIGASNGAAVIIASGDWDGSITNSGTIQGGKVGLLAGGELFIDENSVVSVVRATDVFNGGITNTGEISGEIAGLYVTANTFEGNISNSGTISGGVTGAYISASTFTGDIFNDGVVSGGVSVDGFVVPNDPGFVVITGTHTGDIVNVGTWDAAAEALILQIGVLNGSVTNSGLIEATDAGATAVSLNIGNGTTFTNTGGGTIKGDILFGGKFSDYQFFAEDGGVEGNLIGEDADGEYNDDTIVVRDGTHYFVAHDLSSVGRADNFASFDINAGGVALMGSKVFGSAGGSGYDLNNVDQLNLNEGGHLYVDNQSTLNVGTFSQASGSTLSFYLSEPPVAAATPGTHYGQIRADGPVTLSGTLQAVVDPLAFTGTTITTFVYNDVIVAGSPITTDFEAEQLFGGSFFLSLSHEIDENTVDIRITRRAFDSTSCSTNGQNLGQLLEILFQGGNLSPAQQALLNYLIQLPPDQVCDVFDDATGTPLSDFTAIVVETAGPWKSLVNDRLNGLGSAGCSLAGDGGCFNRYAANETGASQVMTDATPGVDPFDWLQTGTRRVGETAAWGRLIGSWGGTSSAPGAPGMDYSLSGGIVGIDHVFTPVFLAGVAAQYTTDDIDFSKPADDANIDSFEIGAYASWGDTRLYLNANASFIWHDFGIRRYLDSGTAIGDYSGTTVSAYVEAGKIFETEDLRIQPIVAASFAHLETDAYAETGTALTKLNVEGSTLTNFKSMIGARVALPIEVESGRKIVPEARAVWAHEFADDHSTMRAEVQGVPGTLTVNGRKFARDSVILGAGVTAPLSDEASVVIDYDASINPDMVSHTLSAGFRLKW